MLNTNTHKENSRGMHFYDNTLIIFINRGKITDPRGNNLECSHKHN